MQNSTDIAHADSLIQRYEADAEDARRRADSERMRAVQASHDNDPGNAQYLEQEAARFEKKASEYEDQASQLRTQKAELEARLHDLETQRAKEEADHMERLRQLDQEIARVRGTSGFL